MIRDDELQRLTRYAQGLGIEVFFSNKDTGCAAEWQIDGKRITVYRKHNDSKLDLVLSLIHEIAHHLEHIRSNDRQIDEKLDKALDNEEKKRYRKKILDWEIQGTKWWEEIYRDTDCKFPLCKLHMNMEFDIWQYEIYYENGKFPSKKEKKLKLKQLREKYKNGR